MPAFTRFGMHMVFVDNLFFIVSRSSGDQRSVCTKIHFSLCLYWYCINLFILWKLVGCNRCLSSFYLRNAVFWSYMSDVMSSSGHGVWPHAADSSKAQLAQSSCSAIQRITRQDPEGHADPQVAFPAQHIMHKTQTKTRTCSAPSN